MISFHKGGKYLHLKSCLWCLFAFQILMLAVLNLTQLQYHMGYDASVNYLKAMEIAKQGTPFIKNWADTTAMHLDTPVSVAALIYAVTDHIFVSYGIANMIVSIALFYTFYSVLKSFGISDLSRVICLNLIACFYVPFIDNTNDMSYFANVFSSGNVYGLKIVIMLLIIRIVMDMEDHKINKLRMILTAVLLFIAGISSGLYLMMTVIVPCMVYCFYRMFVYNSYQEVWNLKMAVLACGALIMLAGKWIAVHILEFKSADSNMVLIGLRDFWKNAGAVFLGFMELLGAFPYDSGQQALTIQGIIRLMGFFIVLVCVTGFLFSIHKFLKYFHTPDRHALLICIAAFNLAMFLVLNTTYGSMIFETRYLIPVFILLVVMTGEFIDSLADGLIFKQFGVSVLFLVLLLMDIEYDSSYLNTKNNYDVLAAVVEEADRQDVPVVYMYGDDYTVDCRNLRVIDKHRIYKSIGSGSFHQISHWGDYTYYDDAGSVQGKNILITSEQAMKEIPQYIQKQYVLHRQIDKFCIYTAKTNRFDFQSGISGEYSMDFPDSSGIAVANGSIDKNSGSFISDGQSEGYVMYGPYAEVEAGNYDFVINYEILDDSGESAFFDVALDAGSRVLGKTVLDADQKKAVVSVSVEEDASGLEYRVYSYPGTVIRVDSFEIFRKTDD